MGSATPDLNVPNTFNPSSGVTATPVYVIGAAGGAFDRVTVNQGGNDQSVVANPADATVNNGFNGADVIAALLGFNGTTLDRIRSGDISNVAAATGLLDALIAARYNSTRTVVTNGQWSALQMGSSGALDVGLRNPDAAGALFPASAALADALANPTTTYVEALAGLFNGTTFDRQRGNLDNISLAASAAYNSTQTSADQTNYNARGIILTVDVTAVAGAGTFTFEIDAKDPVSGKYVSLVTSANIATTGTRQFTVYPGNTVAANVSASTVLPRTWRTVATYVSGTSLTFSIGASLIV